MYHGEVMKTIQLREEQSIDVYLSNTFAPTHEDFNLDATFRFVTCGCCFEVLGWGVRDLRTLSKFLAEYADEMERTQFDKPATPV